MFNKEDITFKIVTSATEFLEAVASWDLSKPVVLDVETYQTDPKHGKLLGMALASTAVPEAPVYLVINAYFNSLSEWTPCGLTQVDIIRLSQFLKTCSLVGHNYAYDKAWIDAFFDMDSYWKACTRLMWHMASAPSGPRGYGLKDAQQEILGWDKRGDLELVEEVKARGGDLKKGDHYLASLSTLGRYACYDAASTTLLYNKLSVFFDCHDYWWMLEKMVEYSWLLNECTEAGIRVDENLLEQQVQILGDTNKAYSARFIELASSYINSLERGWREDRAILYSDQAAKDRFLNDPSKHKKFKPSSDKDKRELFYSAMSLPVVIQTEGKKPSTSLEAIKAAVLKSGRTDLNELIEAYQEAESAETLLNSFAKPWTSVLRSGRIHPRFNPCGTVSYRLSGFKPYLLNAPFDEKNLMSCMTCDEGWEGVHADFVSVEPAVTAHYSQDPNLLKVFKDGLGDVYLDLARTLYPDDEELQQGYDPKASITGEIKKRFERVRKVAKVIQLAVQYTGTKYTVHKNLSASGMAITMTQADDLVKKYWIHFSKVKRMNDSIFARYQKTNAIRNVVGRIIRVPNPGYKDLPNRFIQSSAHDLLSFWVLNIAKAIEARGITAKAVILDCHDSTTWQAPKDQVAALEQVFKDTLQELNDEIRMTVPVKIDMKRFTTLAGLKG